MPAPRLVLADPPPLTPPALGRFPFRARAFPFVLLRDTAGLTRKFASVNQLPPPSPATRVE